ncbi:MAG: InlB B-repeat-containing protein [Candidatus Izemoplasmatales bacterium]
MTKRILLFTGLILLAFLVSCGERTVSVTFDTGGGTSLETLDIKQLSVLEEPETTREGYTFKGWYQDPAFIDGSEFDFSIAITRNIILYAKWEINQYTIDFVSNNGSQIESITANYQSNITIPQDITRYGYTFAGWYIDNEYTTIFESTRMTAEDLTLYAKWIPILYDVEFYADDVLVTTMTVQHGNIISPLPGIPNHTGYTGRWNISEDEVILGNMTVEAIYEIKTYQVTFIDQWDHVYETISVNHGDLIVQPTVTPAKEGYTFAGYSEDLTTFEVTEDIVVDVLFSPISYLVTFRVQGSQVKSETVVYGDSATAPDVDVIGYVFVSWDKSFNYITEVLEVNAVLTPLSYDIKLYGNGGLFSESKETFTITAEYQSSVNYTNQPLRNGYQFLGWYLNESGTGNAVNLTNYTMPLNGLELYAKWGVVSYKLNYSCLFGSQTSNPLSYDVTKSFNLSEPTSRVGYDFIGWFDALEGGNEVFSIDINTTGDKILYARWAPKTYDITYENLQGTTQINPGNYTIETPNIDLADPSPRTGYTFVGWFDALNGGTEVTQISLGTSGNVTVYAHWIINTYTINFNTNNGELITSKTVKYNEEFILPVAIKTGYNFSEWTFDGNTFRSGIWNLTTDVTLVAVYTTKDYSIVYENLKETTQINPETYTIETPNINLADPSPRTGYTFVGWFDALNDGTEVTQITLGTSGNVTVYARWAAKSYTITFDSKEGEPISAQTVIFDQTFDLPNAIRDQYTFVGWTLNGNSFLEGTWTKDEDITLVAVWTEWPVISFETETTSISQEPGSIVIQPEDPTKTGYTFSGWYQDAGLTTPYVFGTMPSTSITVYAKWTNVTYSISYDNLLGTTQINPETYTIETPNIDLANPSSRTGYTFVGWFDALNGGTEVTQISLGTSGNITIFAHWTPIIYSITYENLQGTTNYNPTTYTITSDNLSLTSPSSRTGYTFIGWFDEAVGGNEFTEIISGSTENFVLYAHWAANEYEISFDTNGGESLDLLFVTYNETFTLPTPSKTNYTFVKWQLNGEDFNLEKYIIDENITLVAIYIGNPMTVSYDTNGGIAIPQDTVNYDSTLAFPVIPIKNGYNFIAWYIDSSLTKIYDFNSPVVEPITLYASWSIGFYSWDIEAIFEQEDLLNSNNITIDPNQPSINTKLINLYYGNEISPVQQYEGYYFDHFIYDGVEYSTVDQLIMVTGDRIDESTIKVYYRKIILTITFAQDQELFDLETEEAIVSFRVYYNDTFLIENGPDLKQPDTGSAVWDRTQFTNIRDDITVYALYYEPGVKTITFIDRSVIKYIASQIGGIIEVIGSESILWDLYRPGYKFLGWYTEEFGGVLITQGDLLFSDFTESRTNLYARWEELTSFNKPENITVVADENEIIITWDILPSTIDTFQPVGFEYLLNNILINNLSTKPVLSGNTFTLTLTLTNPEYELFKNLVIPGTHQLSIRAMGDEVNNYHSEPSDIYKHKNESIYSGDPTEVAVYDYFIIETFDETKRYIFYTNLEYQFGSTYSFEIVTGHEIASALNNKIKTNKISGEFKFRMIRDGYPTVVYDALVVHDIKQFAHGTNYQNYLDAQDNIQSSFLNQTEVYYVGSADEYYLDLRMVNNQGQRIPLIQTYLEYELYQYNGVGYDLVPEEHLHYYIEYLPDNQILMTSNAEGESFKIIVKPKYMANKMSVEPLEFLFTVNSGVNVFNNQELKDAFSDFYVNTINIHASFKAELSTEQKNLDGSPINQRPDRSVVNGNVYQRYSNSFDDDQLTIEGNYMTIDGSQLPFSNPDSGSGTVGFAQSFEIINVQIGMFFYGVKNTALGTTNNNEFSVNNLVIKGNTSTPYIDFGGTPEEIEIQERLMSRDSGGYLGIIVANGESNLNNLIVFNTLIGVTNNAYGYKTDLTPTYVNADYFKIYNSWANSFYLHGGLGYVVGNSEVGQSGGAAFHMVDTHAATFDSNWVELSNPNPYLEILDSTTVSNWISGEEAWFKAYAMSQVALTLKSGIETGILDTERSIINLMTDPVSGLETEKINFVLLTEASSGANVTKTPENTQMSGSEVRIKLGDYLVERSFDYLDSGDPRVNTSTRQFAFPVGIYSDYNAFYALIVEFMTSYGLGANDASSLATLAGFYGLTAEETYNSYGFSLTNSMSFRTALETIYPGKEYPKFIEILAPVPVFPSGYSVVMIEFSK